MKRLSIAAFTLLALILVMRFTVGCASAGQPLPAGYADAYHQWDLGTQQYDVAFRHIETANVRHSVTAGQYKDFEDASAAVRRVAPQVHDAFLAWRATGTKPANFDALYQADSEARAKVVAIAATVP